MMHYGDADVNDFKKFPSTELIPSESVYNFHVDTSENVVLRGNKSKNSFDSCLRTNNTLAFIIYKNDTILYERYFKGYNKTSLILYFSISKSITSLLIGCAIDDKLITSEYDAVTKYIPELSNRGFDTITILDLLQMRVPLKFRENNNPLGKQAIFYYTPNLERHLLKLKLIKKGRKTYEYRSGNTALLGLILKRVLRNETMTEYLQRKIWTPLGMESNAKWIVDNEGFEKAWCCIAGTARDVLKIANLYIQNGKWSDKQIVSRAWIKKTVGPLYESDKNMIYNYNWWLYPSDKAFAAIGKDGQYAYIKPSEKIVIIRLGYNKGKLKRVDWFNLFKNISQDLSGHQ